MVVDMKNTSSKKTWTVNNQSSHTQNKKNTMTDGTDDTPSANIIHLFFGDVEAMRRTLTVLCDSNHKQQGDIVTQTVLTLLSAPLHIQLTATGLQPIKGKDLTFPYMKMTIEQRQAIKELIDKRPERWQTYEHAMIFKQPPVPPLKQLLVLEALCNSVLTSSAYQDKRLRMAICNILLQRVQASMPIERSVQSALNARLFPPSSTPEAK